MSIERQPLQPLRSPYQINFISKEQLALLQAATLEVMESVGVRFPSHQALEIFAAHEGARVDWNKQIVYLRPDLVFKALSTAPRYFKLGARNPSLDLQLEDGVTYFTTDGCGVETIDFETRQRRPSCKEDVGKMALITDFLGSVGFYWPMVSAQDYKRTAPLHELDASWNNTLKHVQTETVMDAHMAKYAIEMATVIAGNKDELRKRPPLSSLICTIAPLAQDRDGMEAALVLARGLFPAGDPPSPWTTWLLAGLCLGLAGLSKYHAALFALGLIIYLVSVPARRSLLRHPAPWVGALIALIVVSPALIWNMQHQWVSLAFQTGRGLPQGLRVGQVFANIAGQMVWILPWIFVPLAIAAWGALRAGRGAERSWYCLCLALPAIALFTIVPLWGSRGLPHWQMPGWLLLYPVLGAYLARAAVTGWPRRWAITSAAALVGLIFIIVGHAATGLGRVWFPGLLAKDPTLEALEWTPLRHELQARGLLDRPELFVVVPHWITAGKIDHALGDALPVVVFGQDQVGRRADGGLGAAADSQDIDAESLAQVGFAQAALNQRVGHAHFGHAVTVADKPFRPAPQSLGG